MRKFLFGGTGFGGEGGNAVVSLLRVFTGIALSLNHGLHKIPPSERFIEGVAGMGFPLPEVFAYAAGLSEFVGGLLLAGGILTRVASLFILMTMLVVVVVWHAQDPFAGTRELGALYGVIAILFLVTGSGRYGLDALVRKGRS